MEKKGLHEGANMADVPPPPLSNADTPLTESPEMTSEIATANEACGTTVDSLSRHSQTQRSTPPVPGTSTAMQCGPMYGDIEEHHGVPQVQGHGQARRQLLDDLPEEDGTSRQRSSTVTVPSPAYFPVNKGSGRAEATDSEFDMEAICTEFRGQPQNEVSGTPAPETPQWSAMVHRASEGFGLSDLSATLSSRKQAGATTPVVDSNIASRFFTATASASSRREPRTGLLACILVLVAFVLGLLFGVLLIHSNAQRATSGETPPQPNPDNICSSPSCAMVVALLTQSVQLDVEPCENFRRHVCGWWHGTNVHSGGYVGGNRAAFHARLGLHLKRLASNSRLVGSGQYQMARFYSACQLYARRQSQTRIEEVLQISGIGAMPWSRAKNSEELFVLMVAEVLRSGLTSIISVKWSDSRLYVDAGTSLSSTMRGLYDHLSTFVTDVLIALGLQEDATLLSAAIRLDSEVERVLSAPPSEFSAFTVCELPPVGYCEHWVRGLNLGLDNRAIISQSTSVMARGLVKLKTLISTLGSANLTVVSIYTLLIPLSQVMRYAYAITPDKTRSRSQDGDFCLRETSERFPTLFPVWVADTVETAESRGYFDEMVAALQQATAELHQLAGGVIFSPADIVESQMKIDYMNKYKPTLSAVVPLSSDDFLRNVITLSGQVHLTHDDAALRRSLQQLSGELRYDGEVFLVPSMYLTGDLLHSEASEPMLDYATAGVPVLVDWARFLVKENATLNAQLSERVACLRKRLQDSVDEGSAPELTSEILHRIALVPWALDVAFVAARMNSPLPEDNVTDVRAKEQVFFRRFCHVACGDPIADILCSHAARSLTWFASTFGCRDVPERVCS